MHETLENKITNQIEDGNSHQVQWGKLLKEFSLQSEGQIVNSLASLSPSQLDSISDGIRQAREESKSKSLEIMKNKMLELGLSGADMAEFFKGYTSGKSGNSERKTTSKAARDKIEFILRESFDTPMKDILKQVKTELGEEINPSVVYTIKSKVKKEKTVE